MRRLKRKLIKWGLCVIFLLGLFFYGINVYFTHVNPLKPKLEAQVDLEIKQWGVHPLTEKDIPDFYKKAVIATEDRRFAWDPGIDPIGMVRSLQVDLTQHQWLQGGSTITQQIVDNTFLRRRKSITYKLTQTLYAIGIYDTFSKSEVFTMYANIIYFGHGAYGLYNASKVYFNKTPNQLNKGELTMLAGLPNSPSNYDPLKHLDLAKARQKVVVQNMVEMGVISNNEAKMILSEPIRLVHTSQPNS